MNDEGRQEPLAPCPFCGGPGHRSAGGGDGCKRCHIFVDPELWNTRASDPAKEAFVAAASEFCRLWTRDARNSWHPDSVGRELDLARGALYEAYRAWRHPKP